MGRSKYIAEQKKKFSDFEMKWYFVKQLSTSVSVDAYQKLTEFVEDLDTVRLSNFYPKSCNFLLFDQNLK